MVSEIQLDWGYIKQVRNGLQSVLEKYGDLFKEELGTLKGLKLNWWYLKVLQAVPSAAIRGAIERDLERLG